MVNLEAFLSDGFVGRIVDEASAHRPVVHATDQHCGRTPRLMAQAPVMLTTPFTPTSSQPLACVFAA
ncbi:hypothetical protein [Mycobacterium sp. JS623]|uniref:hypothetical protein n=1 Tax=Mycobacterium sp. JS623 TaxID=212767 RepID=UPI0002E40F7E|nr:hypothetical protein [Mycobacterium sp. JS623]